MENDDPSEHASRANILKVMELMCCKEGHGDSHILIHRKVQSASEIDIAGVNQIENVFQKGVKSLAQMLLS